MRPFAQGQRLGRSRTVYRWAIQTVYIVTIVALIAAAGWALCHVVHVVWRGNPVPALTKSGVLSTKHLHGFKELFPSILDGLILAVIIIELTVTVYAQVEQVGKADGALTFKLVRDFFVIGTVSAIRHILVIGAKLSLSPGADRPGELNEFRTNTLFVGVLALAMLVVVLAERQYEPLRTARAAKEGAGGCCQCDKAACHT